MNKNTTNENNDSVTEMTQPYVEWSEDHENIIIDWADKALCYKWLHDKAHISYSTKNTWFTIPVIIMSTLTGTANFAQDRIPEEYLNAATMGIGAVNLIAGILTTIQQFLKISELNESHRISSIAWGKFYRNVKIEISKAPSERTPVVQLLKHSKEEYDRLVETSPSLSDQVIKLFMTTFSGGELNMDENDESKLNRKQLIFRELKKPDICGSIEPTAHFLYKRKAEVKIYQNNDKEKREIENTNIILAFIDNFNHEKKRYPTIDEVIDNLDESIQAQFITAVYNNTLQKNSIEVYSDSIA
jgi:hypothetical protein